MKRNLSTTPIRIAFDASCLIPQPLTGVGYYTLHLLEALLQGHAEIDLQLFASSAQSRSAIFDHLAEKAGTGHFARIPTRLKNTLWTTLEQPKIERWCGPVDIAHGGFHLLPAARTAKRVVTVFDLSGVRQPDTRASSNIQMHMRLLRNAARNATAMIAISESCKQDIVEILEVPEEEVHVVYGGVQLKDYDGPPDPRPWMELKARLKITRPYFIHLGTLEPRKNLPRLISAYARVLEHGTEVPQLVLAGRKGWMYEDIFKSVVDHRLEKDVVFTDYLSRDDAINLLKGAYACTYPSLYEGFGLPVLEAMAAHVPVLTSNVSSLPEVAGDTALLVNPESQDEIQNGLESLINEYPVAQERARAAYQRAQQFTWEASARSLANLYAKLMEADA